MHKELTALVENGTWQLANLPLEKKPIASKWVYRIKYNPDSTINRFKARVMAKGYIKLRVLITMKVFL